MYVFGSGGRDGGEWVRGLGLSFSNPAGTGGVWDVGLCLGFGGVCGVGGEGGCIGWGGVMLLCVLNMDYSCRWQVHMSAYCYQWVPAHLKVHPVFNPAAPYRDLLPNVYLSLADVANPDLPAIQRVRMAGLLQKR